MPDPARFDTLCARHAEPPPSRSSPLSPPIYLSAVYKIADLDQIDALYEGREPGFTYRRDGDADSDLLVSRLAHIEGGEDALICASGMGAEAALFLALLEAGAEVALSDNLYGKTVVLAGRELARFGVTTRSFDPCRPDTLRAALNEKTRLVFVETISNPLVRVPDLAALGSICRASGVPLGVDHTLAPLLCRPLELGASYVTHSLTKLIGGHGDVILGALIGDRDGIARARAVSSAFGLMGNPFESWLTLRGLASLGVRSERVYATALELARRLEGHPAVRRVHYPGLDSHPDHELASRVLRGGYGSIATIDLGGRAEAQSFIRRLRHIPFAPSLGDASTTLSHPATTSHRNQTPEQWARQGITPGLVRLSIGLEHPEDLWADMDQALGPA